MAVFFNISAEEEAFLINTPVMITILIAGADSEIDRVEIREAKEIIDQISRDGVSSLGSFYKLVIENFEANLNNLLFAYPSNAKERNQLISRELTRLNSILPKLERPTAVNFYNDMRQLAKHIAEASGGVLGYLSVDKEESKFINLPTVNDPENF